MCLPQLQWWFGRALRVARKECNPAFDGKHSHKIEAGALTELAISTVGVTDLTAVIDPGGGVKREFVFIPAGSFMMGSDKYGSEGKPVHRVTITKPFYMGKNPSRDVGAKMKGKVPGRVFRLPRPGNLLAIGASPRAQPDFLFRMGGRK